MTKPVTVRRIRFGGKATAAGWRFELSGGHAALDFVNTVDLRPTAAPRELLPDYAALLDWCAQSALLPDATLRLLRTEAARRPAAAAACLRRARALRETLFALFDAAAGRRRLPERELALFNEALPAALSRLRLQPSRELSVAWAFAHPPEALDVMLPPLVRAAAELLASPAATRVRRCEGSDCAWLFLDESRNRSRRWCDMTVCGNRAKARRHRARRRGAARATPRRR